MKEVSAVGVGPISTQEFRRLVPLHSIMESFVGKGLEWFANDLRHLIGTIAQNDTNKKWGYMIWGRDDNEKAGDFIWGRDDKRQCRALDLKGNFETRQTAKTRLLSAMQEMEQRGGWRLSVPRTPPKRAGRAVPVK